MDLGFWGKLEKPILALAPMADVTDPPFRRLIAKYSKKFGKSYPPSPRGVGLRRDKGGPDVMWTEFVSADGLCHPKGREKLIRDLSYAEVERPIVAQIFGGNPDTIHRAAALVAELGFDGLDINMGCPDRTVERQGGGAALMRSPAKAREIIRAAKEGLSQSVRYSVSQTVIPVSVKTRLGYNKDELETWLPELLSEEPAAITIHARTRKEMSKTPARWERITEAVKLRDRLGSKTLIFGNGDVKDVADALAKAKETGADGVMLGRAIFGTPWLFANLAEMKSVSQVNDFRPIPPDISFLNSQEFENEKESRVESNKPALSERLQIAVEHAKLYEEFFGKTKSFAVMKKHFKAYVEGFNGAKELRAKLMETENAMEVEEIIFTFLKTLY